MKLELTSSQKTQFEKDLVKLNRRAVKLGCEQITFTVTREYFRPVEYASGHKVAVHMFELEVTGQGPKIDGWNLVASVDHIAGGNIINRVPELKSVDISAYRESCICEHCHTNRFRKKTVIFQNASGELKQVGSTCLKDFFGHTVPAIKWFKDVLDLEGSDFGGCGKPTGISIAEILDLSAHFVSTKGFVSKSNAFEYGCASTANLVLEQIFPNKYTVIVTASNDDKALAAEVLAWAKTLDENADSDYLRNLAVIFKADYCIEKHVGYVVSAISAFKRQIEWDAKKKVQVESNHFGQIKKRDTYALTLLSIRSFDGYYGITHLHKFVDPNGNQATWFGSFNMENDCGVKIGETVEIKATVKKHDEYRGVKQTVLTRCAIA